VGPLDSFPTSGPTSGTTSVFTNSFSLVGKLLVPLATYLLNTRSEEKYSMLYSISAYFLNILDLEYVHIHSGVGTSTVKHLFYGYNQ